jgi:hypothetical protein
MSLYGARNINSGAIEINNFSPKLLLTKQYDLVQYTGTQEQAMHLALGRYTIPVMTLCNQKVGINGGLATVCNLNVGINTLNPTHHLHVTGNTRVVYTGSNQMWLHNPLPDPSIQQPIEIHFDRTYSTPTAQTWLGHRAGQGCNYFFIRAQNGACNATDDMVILPNGNVGLGQVAPIANLHVDQTIKSDNGHLWMSPYPILDSITGDFEVRKTNWSNIDAWEPMISYTATSSQYTPCNFWVRGTASINSCNYVPARMTIDGPRFYIRSSNVQSASGEARIWLSNRNGSTTSGHNEWLIGQSNAMAPDFRISRLSNDIEQHVFNLNPNGDLIVGSNQLLPRGRFHVVTQNLGDAFIYDATVCNVNMPTLQISSNNNGREGAVAFASPTFALYRRDNDIRLRNNDHDRFTVHVDALAEYNGPFRLHGSNDSPDIGELQFGDANHALYRTVDSSLRIRTSNTSRFTVKYNGLVGISNDDPQELLDVFGSLVYGKGPSDQLSYIRANTADQDNDKILLTQRNRNGSKLATGQQSNWSLDVYAGQSNVDSGLFTVQTGKTDGLQSGWARRLVISNSNGNTTIGSNLNPPVKLLVEGEHWANFIKGSNVGSAPQPTYAWTNDPDTGIFNPVPNAIGFATEGTQVMTLSNNRLGVGTTTPRAMLEVTNDVLIGQSQTKQYLNKSLGGTQGDTQHIATLSSDPYYGHALLLQLTVTQTQNTTTAVSQQYSIPLKYNATANQWHHVPPLTHTSSDYAQTLALDLRTNNAVTTLRLRRSQDTPSQFANANITVMFSVFYTSQDTITCLNDASSPSSQPSPNQTYAPTVLSQREQRLGLNTSDPQAAFHLRSSNYDTTLNDIYMTRTISATLESYSPMQLDEPKFIQIGCNDAPRQSASLRYVHRNTSPTASNNLLSIGFQTYSNVINATSAGYVGLNTIHPATPLHVIGETTVTISNNDIASLCNNYQRFISQSNEHMVVAITSRSSECNATLALTHDTLDQRQGGFVKLQGAQNKLHIGQISNYVESNAVTITRTQPVPFVGINTHDPTTSLHVTGNTTLSYSNTTLLLEGSNSAFTLRTQDWDKDLRLLATSNIVFDGKWIGNTQAILSAETGNVGIGVRYEQPQGRLTIRYNDINTRPYDTYMYRLSNSPFESYTDALPQEPVALSFGRSNQLNQAASIRYLHSNNSTSALSNQLQLGFWGAESSHLNLLSMGYLGLGTTSPLAKYHVIGDTASEYFKATLDGTSNLASLTWFAESNTGFYRRAPALTGQTVTGTLVQSASPSNITTHADHTFDQQIRLTVDTTDAKTISPQRVASALSNGNYGPTVQWAAMIDGVADDTVTSMATDSLGNIYLLGYYKNSGTNLSVYNSDGSVSATVRIRGTTNDQATFLVKYSPTGIAQWAISFDATGRSGAASIQIDSQDDLWITGFYVGTPTYYDPSRTPVTTLSFPSVMMNAAYLLKISGSTGIPILATVIDQFSGDEKGLTLTRDNASHIYWGGFFAQGRFGQGTAIVTVISPTNQQTQFPSLLKTANGTSASFVLKFDLAGQILYAINIDTDESSGSAGQVQTTSIALDDDYNLYVSGIYTGQMAVYNATTSTTFSPSLISFVRPPTRATTVNNETTFVVKFSDQGTALWAASLSPTGKSTPTSIRPDTAGKLYVAGFYTSSTLTQIIESDGQPSTRVSLRTTTGSAAYLVKFTSQSGTVDWAASIDGASEDTASQLQLDVQSCPYVTGTYTSLARVYDAGGQQSTTAPLRSPADASQYPSAAYIVKFSPSGQSLWAINVDSSSADSGVSLILDAKCNILSSGTVSAPPVFYDANNLTATNPATSITLPIISGGTATYLVRYANNFYQLNGYSPSLATSTNGVQKLLVNADTALRTAYVLVADASNATRIVEIPARSSQRLMWYNTYWYNA